MISIQFEITLRILVQKLVIIKILIFLEPLNFKTRKIDVFSFCLENKVIEDTEKPHSVSHDRFHTFHERNGHVKQLEENVRP